LRHTRFVFAFDRYPRGVFARRNDERFVTVSYAQDCAAFAPNESNVQYRMLRGNSSGEARRSEIDANVTARGGVARWRVTPKFDRTYALLEFPDGADSDGSALDAMFSLGAPTIALAVSPTVTEALPVLTEVLGGRGRPAGVVACERSGHAVIVEWDLDRTPAALILDLIDTELDRFNAGRVTELLTPLSDVWLSRIAAEGLQCPDMAPDRMLETLIARAGLDNADV
jgi:hypothetical protein